MGGGGTATILFLLLMLVDISYYGFSTAIQQLNIKEIEKHAGEKRNRKSKRLLKLIHNPQNLIDTIQLVITFLNMITGWICMEKFVEFTKTLLEVIISKAFTLNLGVEIIALLASVLTFTVVLYILLLIGVSLPKKIALKNPKIWAYAFVDVIYFINHLLLPFTGLVSVTTRGLMKLMGMKQNGEEGDVTEEEIIHMVNESQEQGFLEASEAEMISNIFEYHDKEAQDIMTNRNQIVAVEGNMILSDAVNFVLDEAHSRYLVYEENIDHIIGILHLKDVMRYYRKKEQLSCCIKDIPGLLRAAECVPLTKNIHDLFEEMQSNKLQMVFVIDEYGQTAGLVAMEDILEEIVGNIMDEYDVEEEYIEEKGQDEYIIEGKTPLDELEERFNICFYEEVFETLNGFMIAKMDKIPEEDEVFEIEVDGYLFKILSVRNMMIHSVLVKKLPLGVNNEQSVLEDEKE